MKPRDVLSWKFLFYQAFLPAIRRLGPSRSDAVLGGLGRLIGALWLPRRLALSKGLGRARTTLRASVGPSDMLRPALAASVMRFQARDYLLDEAPDAEVLARFDVEGFEPLRAALDRGQGAILVGSHLGGYIAALHWLYRRGIPLRLLVQRPKHVSGELNRRFDRDEPHPQSGFFLRRDLSPGQSVERLLRARAALRDGLAVYLSGDIPWSGPPARPGRLLGQSQTFLTVWADLAVLTGAPVFFLFCTHRPGGRFALTIDPPITLSAGEEPSAVARYLTRLESEIASHPADAVAHLLWPCYGPPAPSRTVPLRPSRRTAAIAQP